MMNEIKSNNVSWLNKVLKALFIALKWFFYSFIWVGLLLLALDIVTKNLVFNLIGPAGDSVVLIPGFLRISCVLNSNAAFGLGFTNPTLNRVMYIIVALIGSGLIMGIYGAKYRKISKFVRLCLVMITVGAIGNLIDRMFYSFANYSVIDWIDFYGIWQFNFNIADSCIVVGTILLIIWLIVEDVKESKHKPVVEKPQGKVLSADEKARLDVKSSDDKIADNDDLDENKLV
ncbi:MAG: signal peptidase II [Bacilli bacterium]